MRLLAPTICFRFDHTVPLDELEGTLALARIAAESLHGPERVELEARHEVDHQHRGVTIATTTGVGRSFATIFLGLAKREFGRKAVRVERPSQQPAGQTAGGA